MMLKQLAIHLERINLDPCFILNIPKIRVEKKVINNIWRKKFFEKPCCGEEAFLCKMQYSETIEEMTERDLIK